jgi:putative solute:sodium symporter small subunit
MTIPTPEPVPKAPQYLLATPGEARAHRRYWHFNLILIAVLCVIGGAVSFVLPLYATRLEAVYFRGWSLPYYMGAQGATLIYLLLICIYVVLMQGADRRLQRALAALAPASGLPSVSATEPRA